ncbi:MAG: hypothetical protein NC548_22405 [Lachnospiraceae bacterium]|nr:hypothetical protein [Lachnospiraceae bacterium]
MDNRKIFKIYSTANTIYSILWIAITGKDKYSYHEESRVHQYLSGKAFEYLLKAKNITL